MNLACLPYSSVCPCSMHRAKHLVNNLMIYRLMKIQREFREETEHCVYHQLILQIMLLIWKPLCPVPQILLPASAWPGLHLLEQGCHRLTQYSGHPGPVSGLPWVCLLSTVNENCSLGSRAVWWLEVSMQEGKGRGREGWRLGWKGRLGQIVKALHGILRIWTSSYRIERVF